MTKVGKASPEPIISITFANVIKALTTHYGKQIKIFMKDVKFELNPSAFTIP